MRSATAAWPATAPTEPQFLARVLARPRVVDRLDEADRLAAVDERDDEDAAVALAAQGRDLGGVGAGVVDVDHARRSGR